MKITYIGHSGFAAELAHCTLLFDYYEGTLPVFPSEKPLYVFCSHTHRDHFNFDIFRLREMHPDVTYILSRDIRRSWNAAGFARHGVAKEAYDALDFLRPYERTELGEIAVETLDSTDEGVAFLVSAEGKTLFHAGDLNDWVWNEESPEENCAMPGVLIILCAARIRRARIPCTFGRTFPCSAACGRCPAPKRTGNGSLGRRNIEKAHLPLSLIAKGYNSL